MAPLGSVRKVEEKGQGLDFDSRLNLDTFRPFSVVFYFLFLLLLLVVVLVVGVVVVVVGGGVGVIFWLFCSWFVGLMLG